MERRKLNVQNYGSSWMKPPGVFRSLHQIREEEREMKEHAEAMRREQLAQELAEAEAVEELMDDDLMETRNLDDDIPDQDDLSASEEDDDSDDSDDERNEARVPSVMVQHISEDMYTEAVIQGDSFGAEGGLNPTDEDRSQMFEEDDIAHDDTLNMNVDLDMDVDMDGDLDGSVLDGEISGYEHTDTDDELTSSEADSDSS